MSQKEPETFRILCLGCRTNKYEILAYQNQLEAIGLLPAEEKKEADLCIVNTCTVTKRAEQESLQTVRRLVKENPQARIVVTGCASERNAKAFSQIPSVEKVIPNQEKETLVEQIFPREKVPEFSVKTFPGQTRAFVKIQDGCNSFCSYCIIPFVRGRSRSRKVSDILQEIHALVENGYREIVLTGINIGDFDGGDPLQKSSLADLVRIVDQIEGVERIRISSIDPDEVDENLLDAVIHGKKCCHSLHIVLQSGSNEVLKRMHRKYTVQQFFDSVDSCLQRDPDFTFTTDVIVGFPGESEGDFTKTLEAIRRVQFAKVHMFPYSRRPKTRASRFIDVVPPETVRKRRESTLQLASEVAYALRQKYVGRTMNVLLEGGEESDPTYMEGYTENFLRVKILRTKYLRSNTIIPVQMRENQQDSLLGSLVDSREIS